MCHKGCHCPQHPAQRDFPTSQEPTRAKIICSTYPATGEAALCGLGPQDCGPCYHCLSAAQRLDGPRALQASVHSSQGLFIILTHNLFQRIKPASSFSGIKKKKSLWYKQWEKQIQFKEIKIGFPKTTEVLQVLGEDIVGDCSTLMSLGAD